MSKKKRKKRTKKIRSLRRKKVYMMKIHSIARTQKKFPIEVFIK